MLSLAQKQTFSSPPMLSNAAPVLKWAGGKTQLLPIISQCYPKELLGGSIKTYVEPFVGGGSVYFDLFNRGVIEKAYLLDTNPDLIQLYETIQQDVTGLIVALGTLEREYLSHAPERQAEIFYEVREAYNASHPTPGQVNVERSAQTIFLNRTCFNGLFRVNSKGKFNVPFGKHARPTILFEEKLQAVSNALQKAELVLGDFELTARYANNKDTFVYFDPPYRPISQTSHFKSYSKEAFNDESQERLAALYRQLDGLGVKLMLSNSDPTNHVEDPFFDKLYAGFNIQRVHAKRMINSKSGGRGAIRELLITNYA